MFKKQTIHELLYALINLLLGGLSRLPYRFLLRLGAALGPVCQRSQRAYKTALINIQTCFPDKDAAYHQALLQQYFRTLGMSIFETIVAWWAPDKKLEKLVHLQGLEHVINNQCDGQGTIFLCAHQTGLELAGRLLSLKLPFSVTYLPPKHPLLNMIVTRRRQLIYQQLIKKHELKRFYKALLQGDAIFYAGDTDVGQQGAFVPFFNQLASTTTLPSRFAHKAQILPTFFYRRATGDGYDIIIHPPLEAFPGDNEVDDSTRINRLLEEGIRLAPEQYLWQYKRFKTRPPGEPDLYS